MLFGENTKKFMYNLLALGTSDRNYSQLLPPTILAYKTDYVVDVFVFPNLKLG